MGRTGNCEGSNDEETLFMTDLCKNCHAGCCRLFLINVTGADILRIKQRLGLPPKEFVHFEEFPAQKADGENMRSILRFKDKDPETVFVPVLRKVESDLIPETKKCLFLQEWRIETPEENRTNVVSRCGVYDIRPHVCQAWPIKLDENEFLPACGSVIDSKKFDDLPDAYKRCSREFSADDFGPTLESSVKAKLYEQYEMGFDAKVAEKWNQNPGTMEEYEAFLEDVYKNRIQYP